MKKVLMAAFAVFIVFGILASSYFVLADDNQGPGPGPGNVNSVIAPNPYASEDHPLGNFSPEDALRGRLNRTQLMELEQQMAQQRINRSYEDHGMRVNVEREMGVGNGSNIVNITQTVTYANGTTRTYTIQIQSRNGSGKTIRNINMEREGEHYNVSVQDGMNVSDYFFGNRSEIVANLSNGKQFNVSILPDQALRAALAKMRMNQSLNGTNISLQERMHNHIPQVVYNIQTNQHGRFLGIFKVAMKANTEVDAGNGNVISVGRPWWAFLVALPKGSLPPENGNSTNSTNSTNSPMIPVNSTNVTGTNSTGNSTNSS